MAKSKTEPGPRVSWAETAPNVAPHSDPDLGNELAATLPAGAGAEDPALEESLAEDRAGDRAGDQAGNSGQGMAALGVGPVEERDLYARVSSKLFGTPRGSAFIGRFEVIERVGAGGMGVVYATRDPELDRKVAVKLLHPRLIDAAVLERSQKRMRAEARAMARLNHPNVVTIYEVGSHDDQLFMAMEYVDGQNLGDWLGATPRSPREVIGMFCAAGEGLAAAHDAGLVHRDFKPDNVLIGSAGAVKVTDFGLASLVREWDEAGHIEAGESLSNMTRTGEMLGTPLFMAPEQFARETTDARSDQFSFCVALYTALLGQRPFDTQNFAQLMLSVTHGKLRARPQSHGAPLHILDAVERGLSRDPELRWPSMRPLLAVLRRDSSHRRKRRNRAAAGALSIGVVAAALGFALATSTQPGGAPSCAEQSAARLAERWTPALRERVDAALRASSSTHSSDTSPRVLAALDAYAQAWVETTRQACESAQLDTLAHERTRCLDERRASLVDLAELIEDRAARTSALDLDLALDAAEGLPPVSRCLDPAYLGALAPLPDDPALEGEVEALRHELAVLRTRLSLGDATQSLDALDALGPRVAALSFPGLDAEVALLRGRALSQTDEYAEADAQFKRAFLTAESVGHVDANLAAGIARLETMVLQNLAPEVVDQWSQLLEAKLELGGSDLDRADYHEAMFNVYTTRGDMLEARAHGEACLRLRTEVLGDDHVAIADVLNHLSHNALVLGRHEQGLEASERALAILSKQRRPSHRLTIMALRTRAQHYQSQRKLELARDGYLETLRLAEQEYGPDHSQVAEQLMALGGVLLNLRASAEAQVHLQRALVIHERVFGAEHPRVAADLSMLGVIAGRLGDHEAAVKDLQRALALVESIEDRELEAATVSNYLGHEYQRVEAYAQAEPYYLRAIELLEAKLGPDPAIARAYLGNLADLYTSWGKPGPAREWGERSLKVAVAHHEDDSATVNSARLGLADALWVGGERAEARALVRSARTTHAAAKEPSEHLLVRLDEWLSEHD